MGQRGFVVEQNPLNIVTLRQFLRDLTTAIFAPLLLVKIKSLRGTLMDRSPVLQLSFFNYVSYRVEAWSRRKSIKQRILPYKVAQNFYIETSQRIFNSWFKLSHLYSDESMRGHGWFAQERLSSVPWKRHIKCMRLFWEKGLCRKLTVSCYS